MLTIQANPFANNLQRILGTVSVSDSFSLFGCLFVDRMILTALSQFPTCYSTLLSFLLQTVALCLILCFLAIHATFTCYF